MATTADARDAETDGDQCDEKRHQRDVEEPELRLQPLDILAVRATEYSVGTSGPAAMPGELPPSSAYTYAVELSVDQALAAAATRVNFDRPVPLKF